MLRLRSIEEVREVEKKDPGRVLCPVHSIVSPSPGIPHEVWLRVSLVFLVTAYDLQRCGGEKIARECKLLPSPISVDLRVFQLSL